VYFKMHAMREMLGGIMKTMYLPCPACLSLPSWVSPQFPLQCQTRNWSVGDIWWSRWHFAGTATSAQRKGRTDS